MDKQAILDDVMDNLDFEAIKATMKLLDWRWCTAADGVPTLPELRMAVRKLINDVIDNDEESVTLGGFCAEYDKEDEWVRVSFVLTDWETSPTLRQ